MWNRANQLRCDGTDIDANPVLDRFWKVETPEPGDGGVGLSGGSGQRQISQPYREEKDPEDQSAVNTIRVVTDGQPLAISQFLPRLKAVVATPEDRILFYVPKELRDDAIKLSKKLRDSRGNA